MSLSIQSLIKKTLTILIGLAALGIVLLAGGIGYLWIEYQRPVSLPTPTGLYEVGRMETEWTDPTREETLSGKPGEKRVLAVWIWYPAVYRASDLPAAYLPPAWASARRADTGIFALLMPNYARVNAHSYAGALASEAHPSYPVLVMQPGLGPSISDYTTLVEDLASQGYIVVASNPTYSSNITVFKDRRVLHSSPLGSISDNATPEEAKTSLDRLINIWAADDHFVINQLETLNASGPLAGKLDLEKIGVFGHSFGGASTAQLCSIDARCKAGADLDGTPFGDVITTGLHQPFLFFWSERVDPNSPETQTDIRNAHAILAPAPQAGYELTLIGARHFNFSDYAVLAALPLKWQGALGPIDGRRGLEVIRTYLLAFFDRYLKGEKSPLLNGPSTRYPEVQFNTYPRSNP